MAGSTFLTHLLLCLCWIGIGGAWAASPTPLSVSPQPSASVSAEPTPEGPLLTAAEQSSLLREFTRAQYTEVKGIEHRYELENEELKATQKIRLKEWKSREQAARHKFWEDHDKGQDKRVYVQDYLERFNVFRKSLADEKKAKAEEQKAHLLAVKKEQAANYKEFRKYIDKKIRPPKSLWPLPGR